MRVLLIDDEENLLVVLADQLTSEGFEVTTASDPETGLELVFEVVPDVVITDLRMQEMDGITLAKRLRKDAPDIPVIVLTAHGEVSTAVEAIKAGAADYLLKPVDSESLPLTLRRVVRERKRKRENLYMREEMTSRLGYLEFVGESDEAREIRDKIERAAESDAPGIISGETGVGKELVARLIHGASKRADRPFVIVNCRGDSGAFLLDELFGRTSRDHPLVKSKLEIAHGGSILLDEFTSLPLEIQGQLLQVIESGIVEPGGGRRSYQVNVRFLATSSLDLQEAVKEGSLEADLYHRLNVLSFEIPRLAERRADIPLLAEHFVRMNHRSQGEQATKMEESALTALSQYEWPGNVRELSNVVQRAAIMSIDGRIKLSDLPTELIESTQTGQGSQTFVGLREKLLAEEKKLILKALERNSYIQRRAAKALGISRSLLNQKIKRLEIQIPE